MKDLMDRIARISVLFLFALILCAVFFYRPFFGLMDDAVNLLFLLPKLQERGVFAYAWEYAKADLSWGMFRPTNPLMIYGLYSIGKQWGSVWMFAVNALTVLGILYANAFILARILKINLWLVLLTNLAFFYTLDLFQFPSLQEKMVLLFGAALLACSYSRTLKLPWKLLGISVFTILGVFVKASFCIYIAVGAVALLDSLRDTPRKRASFILAFVALLDILGVLFLAYVAKHGHYTVDRYSTGKILANLLSIDGAMFLLPCALFLALFFRKKNLIERPGIFVPVIGVFAFLAIFLPWGIKAYIQSVVSPLFAALLIQLAETLLARQRTLWISALIALALTIVSYRCHTMFTRLNEIGRIVEMAPALYKNGVQEIYMPCEEGAHSLEIFFQYAQNTAIKVTYFGDMGAVSTGKILFYDQGLCPLPGKVDEIPGYSAEYLYKSPMKYGFKLVRETRKL